MQKSIPSASMALSAAAVLLLGACAAPNPYRPLDNGIGYTEANIAKDKYEIMFHGTTDQDELTAKKYAILRAAEVAKHEKFDYFKIDNAKSREKEEKEVTRETVTRVDRPYDPYDPYPGPYWGKRTRRRTVVRTEKRPVVKITVTLKADPCDQCLSADTTIAQATEAGVFEH